MVLGQVQEIAVKKRKKVSQVLVSIQFKTVLAQKERNKPLGENSLKIV